MLAASGCSLYENWFGHSASLSQGLRVSALKPIYPASILGFAMVARGEIGVLVSFIAESKGIFGTKKIRI